MKLSLIITTYNWPEALQRVLFSAFHQTLLPKEIIVADDGSSSETSEMVKRMANGSPIPIIYSWQKNKGFRAAMARNQAIALAQSPYIVMIDQDMILDHQFCEDHAAAARHGFFIQGSRVLLKEKISERILTKKDKPPGLFDAGVENRKNRIRSPVLSRLFSNEVKNLKGIKTCNFSFWRSDAVAVNGFNEGFITWGREDSEFAARLMHNGIRRRNLRFRALAFHLHHRQEKKDDLAKNDAMLAFTIANRLKRCDNGLDKYLEESQPFGEK